MLEYYQLRAGGQIFSRNVTYACIGCILELKKKNPDIVKYFCGYFGAGLYSVGKCNICGCLAKCKSLEEIPNF